jgi:hypothetical protein
MACELYRATISQLQNGLPITTHTRHDWRWLCLDSRQVAGLTMLCVMDGQTQDSPTITPGEWMPIEKRMVTLFGVFSSETDSLIRQIGASATGYFYYWLSDEPSPPVVSAQIPSIGAPMRQAVLNKQSIAAAAEITILDSDSIHCPPGLPMTILCRLAGGGPVARTDFPLEMTLTERGDPYTDKITQTWVFPGDGIADHEIPITRLMMYADATASRAWTLKVRNPTGATTKTNAMGFFKLVSGHRPLSNRVAMNKYVVNPDSSADMLAACCYNPNARNSEGSPQWGATNAGTAGILTMIEYHYTPEADGGPIVRAVTGSNIAINAMQARVGLATAFHGYASFYYSSASTAASAQMSVVGG